MLQVESGHMDRSPKPPRGKILRVKWGYNPNSSSIGSIVTAVPMMLLAGTALFGTAAAVIASALATQKDPRKEKSPSPGEEEPPSQEK